ncbi:uncharacterized protein [Aegilops tauschii subsp. strangulata]|uniref:uncharacterized protein n=1 Tax=Aegilops tauschii subsp. strangulata TaxID=200361 RepID=UPI00098BAAF0|nr:uncharacterized protein LOC109737820 [Aegilops tauschii subsp. strangulata]
MSRRFSGMATDLFRTHRILFALLEKGGITIIRELESRGSVQKLAKILLKASGGGLLNDILADIMDRYSKHDSKESLRRTIMEHDEVFRQQVHELHRLYRVQKALMAELRGEKHSFQLRTEDTREMVQGHRPNLKNSSCTSETSQSACLGNAQYSDTRQVPEQSFLQECKPVTCLNLFDEETSRNQERRPESSKSVEGESWSVSMEGDLDLKLSIAPSSNATKAPHWLFSDSRERNPSGQHR